MKPEDSVISNQLSVISDKKRWMRRLNNSNEQND
jgi:hypothetical protein